MSRTNKTMTSGCLRNLSYVHVLHRYGCLSVEWHYNACAIKTT